MDHLHDKSYWFEATTGEDYEYKCKEFNQETSK